MNDISRVVILGANGYIGRNLSTSLRGLGAEVVCVGRQAPADLILDLADVESLPKSLLEKSTVVHLATSIVPGSLGHGEFMAVQRELDAFARLLEYLDKVNARRIVFLSSGGCVYGPASVELISEDHPTQPVNSYGYLKLACESLIHIYAHQCNLDSVILRPSNCYGPGQPVRHGQGVLASFVERINLGKPIILFGDGSVERDYLHVDDLVSAIIIACKHDRLTQKIFNVGTGQTHSLRWIIDTFKLIAPDRISIDYQPSRSFDVPRIGLDSTAFQVATGWKPCVQLDNGIKQLWIDSIKAKKVFNPQSHL